MYVHPLLLPCYFFSKDGTVILLGEGWAMLRPWLWWRDGYMECRLLLMSVFGWGGHAAAVKACCPAHRYFSGPLSFLLHYSTSSGRDYCRACNTLFSEHTASVHMREESEDQSRLSNLHAQQDTQCVYVHCQEVCLQNEPRLTVSVHVGDFLLCVFVGPQAALLAVIVQGS